MEKVRLSKIAQISAGQAAPKEFSDFGLPFIRAGHLEELIDGKKLNELPKVNDDIEKKNKLKVIPAGSILFAKSGMSATKNRIFITTENSYYVSHLAAVIPSPKYDSSYLARFLSWYNPTNLILDNAYPSIRLEDINNLEIPLPNLATQQRIAAILDQADAIIQNNRAIVQKYDALTQSLFLDMFGDPVKNEKGWEIRKMEEISLKITDGTHQSPKFLKEGIPFLLVSNIVNNKINYKTNKFISEEDFETLNKRTPIEIGNILLTSVGSYGNPAIIESQMKFAFQRHIAFIKPNHSMINYHFLFHFLKSDLIKREIDKKVKGAAQKTYNLVELKKLRIILPTITLQNQFAERVAVIEAQKQQAQLELAKSEELFASLLQRAFKGELN